MDELGYLVNTEMTMAVKGYLARHRKVAGLLTVYAPAAVLVLATVALQVASAGPAPVFATAVEHTEGVTAAQLEPAAAPAGAKAPGDCTLEVSDDLGCLSAALPATWLHRSN